MAYEVMARKWRPRQFDEVVGQAHVTNTLKNAILSKRIAHAYLFTGPRGTGKTSIARIFAKALNCEKGPTAIPCDQCDSCREISAGTSLDVMEIDGASNNSVDQVRDLRDTVRYAPARGPLKIYIIDEVHMLSASAFNALLKTLEEPPPHVKFIFATTEPEKILSTILSRCQRFDLKRIPVAMIVERLKLIARTDRITIDDDALLAIARGAEGGLRDAESALDQLIAFKGTEIAESDVLSVFGLVSRGMMESVADKILAGDARGLLSQVGELNEAGKDLQRFVVELLGHFRNLLVWRCAREGTAGLDILESQLAALKRQAELADTEKILRITDLLIEAEERMRFALSRRTLLETVLIKCARAATVVSLEEILSLINSMRNSPDGPAAGGAAGRGPAPAAGPGGGGPTVRDGASPSWTAGPEADKPAGGFSPAAGGPQGHSPSGQAPAADERGALTAQWSAIVAEVGKLSIGGRSVLIDARPKAVHGDHVVIGFDPEFGDEIEMLKSSRDRKAVERVLSQFLKRAVRAEFEVWPEMDPGRRAGSSRRREARPAPSEASEDVPSPVPHRPEGKGGKRRPRQEWMEDPAVKTALGVFKGGIVDIRE